MFTPLGDLAYLGRRHKHHRLRRLILDRRRGFLLEDRGSSTAAVCCAHHTTNSSESRSLALVVPEDHDTAKRRLVFVHRGEIYTEPW